LQRKDADMLTHGVEIGIIRQLPNGGFVEDERPLTEEERAVIESKQDFEALPAPEESDPNGVPAPSARGALGKARAIANRAFTETAVAETNGHGYGHGNGNGHGAVEDDEHAAVGADGSHADGSHEEH
jgi:ubiquinol-cytochrome c reductase cytochrome b subunit